MVFKCGLTRGCRTSYPSISSGVVAVFCDVLLRQVGCFFFARLKQMADKPRGRRPSWIAGRFVNANTLELVEKKMPGPRGRPPKGYVWKGGHFVHEITREPFEERRRREERQRARYCTQKRKYSA